MTSFAAALSTMCLSYADAAELLPGREGVGLKVATVQDMARGKTRVPADVWSFLQVMWEAVEQAADEIIADQGEADGGTCTLPLNVDLERIDLPHEKLRMAAVARAVLLLGPELIVVRP